MNDLARPEEPFPRHPLRDGFALWFGTRPVGRGAYAISVLLLFLLRYGADAAAYALWTGRLLDPLDQVSPLLSARLSEPFAGGNELFVTVSLAAFVPFFWLFVSLSVRRGRDAGFEPWIGWLALVPVVNGLLIVVLSLVPSQAARTWPHVGEQRAEVDNPMWGLCCATAGAAVGLAMIAFSVFPVESYGATLFVGVPFAIGCVSAFAYNIGQSRSAVGTQGVVQIALLLVAGGLLSFALEGIVCIAMAYPLAAPVAAVGGSVGRMAARLPTARVAPVAAIVLAWPLLTGVEATRRHTPLREVRSSVEIDAPPAAVWPHVIGFETLPPPREWVFRLGIAYPQRARIEGRGVGAVRHCEFSTGAFVEPITRWEEPSRLSFDVASQPPPMHEWSPYQHVNAPHLVGTMRSRRGEFRLVALPGERTRLEGSTWYELEIFPQTYWTLFSDALIHDIHTRVLGHIKVRAETARVSR